ncbi:hypothetical protein D1872_274810 [compost metagenome]
MSVDRLANGLHIFGNSQRRILFCITNTEASAQVNDPELRMQLFVHLTSKMSHTLCRNHKSVYLENLRADV